MIHPEAPLVHERQPISAETKEWTADLDAVLPIDGGDLPGFRVWVNSNGFLLDRETGNGHNGFDFGAYLREDGIIVVGLPESTPVRAVADGVVRQVLLNGLTGGPYGCTVNVEHGSDDSGMFSGYTHIDPTIEAGAAVQKGDQLGTLYKDPGEHDGRLVHLHMSLVDGWGTHGTSIMGGGMPLRLQDTGLIDPSIYEHTVAEQGFAPFDFSEVSGAIGIEVANFDSVKVNNHVWQQ